MGIMSRFIRLCRADIHGVMDHLEDKGLLLKQHLRDMEEAVESKDNEYKQLAAALDQAGREYEKYSLECEKLDEDITAALEKDKDNIARLLIKKRKPLSSLKDELERHMKSLQRDMAALDKIIIEQRAACEELKLRSREYFLGLEQNKRRTAEFPYLNSRETPDEEVELELLQRKEALREGANP